VSAERPLAVLGPTGYTGRLVCAEARKLGLRLRLVGRRRQALVALAEPEEDVRVADARDRTALVDAFAGAFAVVSLAGPFLENGFSPVDAALAAGAHYLDSSGEQAFARSVYELFGPPAHDRGLVLLTSFGFDYVLGDLAARIAADGLEPLGEVAVAYSVSSMATSRGTRRTIGRLLAQEQVAYDGGTLVRSSLGATTRRFRFPFGEADAVEWSGTEPLTVPRHTRVGRVRSYVRGPRVTARLAGLARLAAPMVRASAGLGAAGPSAEKRGRARFAVVAEARGPGGGRRATLVGRDPYGLTALLLARGADALRAGSMPAAGALAPAEAFEPRVLIAQLSPLLEVHAVEEI
jgi:short subunit dehydrogenase-like uncharacterized protein